MMEVKKLRLDASIVIITAYATVDTAITAMKEGRSSTSSSPATLRRSRSSSPGSSR